jgi:hypothetical protein
MSVGLHPIADADIDEVADFLRTNLDPWVPWAHACVVPWKVEAPNHGFMLRDRRRIVGVMLGFYAERLVAGRVERFCNLCGWTVLPEFRLHSIRLIKAMLAQDGYHFTVLSPIDKVVPILTRFKFRSLDTSAVLFPNLPGPSLPGRTKISADRDVIASTLTGAELELYQDHERALAARHLVLIRGERFCYVMYRVTPLKGIASAEILHVSDPELFKRAIIPVSRHMLLRHGLLLTRAELRTILYRPLFSFKRNPRPKMYLSASLDPEQLDDLYSEFECVPDEVHIPKFLGLFRTSPSGVSS